MPQSQLAQLSLSSTSTTLTFLFLLDEIGSLLFSPVLCLCFFIINNIIIIILIEIKLNIKEQ